MDTGTLIAQFKKYALLKTGRLLVVDGSPLLLEQVEESGFKVTRVTHETFDSQCDRIPAGSFAACILGAASNCFPELRRLLLPQGTLVLTHPAASFDQLQISLLAAGFGDTVFTHSLSLARAKELVDSPQLSVIVPVYNEAATCDELLSRLTAKTIEDLPIEIIIVESNSNDGSREIVQGYVGHPRVRVLFEQQPHGKGHAVRHGLAAATGTIVLIQDADLEYDISDYDALVAPIMNGEVNFVLGSRHTANGSTWKIRKFSTGSFVASFFNFGHLLFLTLFNLLYSQRLTDPFTMYKVFRRDCLYGLSFECDRFDFDYELVIKLLRKGYQPLELPVNYVSRSLEEGKKVRMFRDPVTWIIALLKFRKSQLYDLK